MFVFENLCFFLNFFFLIVFQSEEKKPKLEKAIYQTEKVVAKENIQLDASQTKMVPKTENAANKFEQENAAKLTAASGLMSLLGDYGSDSDDES